jgi:hypothetical protein
VLKNKMVLDHTKTMHSNPTNMTNILKMQVFDQPILKWTAKGCVKKAGIFLHYLQPYTFEN